jgi:predicted peptidase
MHTLKHKLLPLLTAALLLVVQTSLAAGHRFLIDLGTPVQPTTGWNNLDSAATGAGIADLADYPNGNSSGIALTVLDAFWCTAGDPGASNRDGTTSGTVYPGSATYNSFFVADHLGTIDLNAKVRFSGLSSEATYTLRLYASRMATDGIDRTTRYTINGIAKDLQITNNVDNYVEFTDLLPVNGNLDIAVDIAPGATYGFLGVIELIELGHHLSVDLGTPVVPTTGWNNLTSALLNSEITDLQSQLGDSSGIRLQVLDSFWSTAGDPGASNRDGTLSSTVFPASATQNSFFVVDQNGVADLTAKLRFSGLSASRTYDMRLYGSRMTTTDILDRSTQFVINGVTRDLQVSNNVDNYVEYNGLVPVSGNLDVAVSIKPGAFAGLLGLVDLVENAPNGLKAEHYNGRNFESLAVTRLEPNINNDWPTGSPDASVSADNFSNRWTGKIQPKFTETYTFTTRSDDGVRLWVNGVQIINNWTNHFPVDNTGTIALVANTKYDIKMEHYEADLGSVAQLSWQSPSQPKQIVPQSAFFPPVPTNLPPTASAGVDQVTNATSVSLNGTGSDPDGVVASYRWTKAAGGVGTITNPIADITTATGLAPGAYTFRLTVNDNKGLATSDDMIVTVNAPPTANAGVDKLITLPTSSVSLAGTGTDSDGTISSYAWSKVSGGAATIVSPTAATTSVTGLVAGAYVFRLTVTDNRGGVGSDDVAVTVNVAPTANAGTDKTINTPASSVSLTGSGSDSDGTISTYAWTKVSGGSATIASPSAATTNVTGLVVGSYTFRLTVTDNRGATGSDDVIVIVNSTPTANAGSDQTIVAPTSSATLTGSGSDSDGTITYGWTKVSGTGGAITSPAAATTSVTGLTPGVYTFRLTVTDNRGATDADDVVVSVASAHVETLRAAGSTTAPYGFVEYLPEGYNLQSNWPIIIFLHGIGERLPATLGQLASFGPNRYASPNHLNHKLPCVILEPQCPASPATWQFTEQNTIEQFRIWAMANYKVNPKRFYLTGLSMGGFGTSTYLNTVNRGRQVAAAVSICPLQLLWAGSGEVVDNNVPVWAAHAMDDPTTNDGVGVTIGSFANISQRLGGPSSFAAPTFTNPPTPPAFATKTAHFDAAQNKFIYEDGQHSTTGVPQYFCTIYSSGGHVIWNRMYDDPQIYTWLFQFSRP